MQPVLAYIDGKTQELRSNPFIQWLNDDSVPARERLSAWLPCAAYFVLSFKDLNSEIPRYSDEDAKADPLKKAINDHVLEDSNHWPWYLSDLRTLDLDGTMRFSQALRLLWSSENRLQRMAMYEFCVLAARAQCPFVRYSLLAAVESYAHLLFGALVRVSETFEEETGIRLSYLGPVHFEREPGHLANQHDDTEDLFRSCVFDDNRRALALESAGKVWELIDARWREFHRYATAHQALRLAAAV